MSSLENLIKTRMLILRKNYSVLHKVGIFVLKSENSFDSVINHITFNAMHHEKFHFM